ncbi:MAG: hypothetical protein K8S18_15425 [Desulfobacula sp.]|nr:hypothetical protein [Desulfobacula sp.]
MPIRLTIRLFATLSLRVPDYDHKKGILVDAPYGVTPADLLKDMKIPLSHIGFISDGNKAIAQDTLLADKMTVSFFSLVSGG